MYNDQAFNYFKNTFNYNVRFSRISEAGRIDSLFWTASDYLPTICIKKYILPKNLKTL